MDCGWQWKSLVAFLIPFGRRRVVREFKAEWSYTISCCSCTPGPCTFSCLDVSMTFLSKTTSRIIELQLWPWLSSSAGWAMLCPIAECWGWALWDLTGILTSSPSASCSCCCSDWGPMCPYCMSFFCHWWLLHIQESIQPKCPLVICAYNHPNSPFENCFLCSVSCFSGEAVETQHYLSI